MSIVLSVRLIVETREQSEECGAGSLSGRGTLPFCYRVPDLTMNRDSNMKHVCMAAICK
jgi:hypothetical protein